MKITEVSPSNIEQEGIYCVKNVNDTGYQCKKSWYLDRYKEGLRLLISKDKSGKPQGFIEYIPAEFAWRPIAAPNYMFIHCIAVYSKGDRNDGLGTSLIDECIKEAKRQGKDGVCVTCSKGSWIASKEIYEKRGFQLAEKKERFELYYLPLKNSATPPSFPHWEKTRSQLKGWHLHYADQCPWHNKSVQSLIQISKEKGINLQVKHLKSAQQIQSGSTGYGAFALVKDGKELADHYISATRFNSIIQKEIELA